MVDKATTQIQHDCGIRVLVFIKLIENYIKYYLKIIRY
ncbi:hypothetical protein AXF03_11735 [Staphylococcus aureus]|uniref:Uncharacterized protein n=1 Tax=Staphylococcus aureus TaxID=1280 RepID=A0AA40JMH6_STAAU|nr:hypothetical protein QU38_11200 [Staphylococcus aureus]MCO4430923.1 hypothetical protein [Staphylococcus aureus]OQO32982.1 hypothetical protein A0U86_10840 [Staphylococcus aureus]